MGATARRADGRMGERAVQAEWAAGRYRGATLRAGAGEALTVVYEGRRGGPAGPDFRDAVLAREDGRRVYGDVEIHLSAGGWRAHGHDRDPRYDGVVVHLVTAPSAVDASPLANGGRAPIALLGAAETVQRPAPGSWPCVGLAMRMPRASLQHLLAVAGARRFAEKAAAFERELAAGRAAGSRERWGAWDAELWLALAESLGYGRDRAALRALGEYLLADRGGQCADTMVGGLPSVERSRAAGLAELRRRWDGTGPWDPVRGALVDVASRQAVAALIEAVSVPRGRIGRGRALIALANVALPYAAARARLEGDGDLGARAEAAYAALPGLPSNAITRLLARQLGLQRLPGRAIEHQGLQHLWAAHCRRKECAGCPCAMA